VYLRRVRVVSRCFAATLTYFSTVVTPPASEAQDLGVGLRRPCRGQTRSGVLGGDDTHGPCATRHVGRRLAPTEVKCEFLKSSFFRCCGVSMVQ
jgi:hypothetical protein